MKIIDVSGDLGKDENIAGEDNEFYRIVLINIIMED